jgi:GNAT superfamily N-acetyltransferase
VFEFRRAVRGDDLRPLWNAAFEPDEVFFTRDYQPENAFICADNGKPVSMLHLQRKTITAGGESLSAGYLMGIATDPAYRRRGLAGKLIEEALRVCENLDCAFLIPASENLAVYYAKFGLTLRGRRPSTGHLSPCTGKAGCIETLSGLYERAYPDRAERTVYDWETILLEYDVRADGCRYTVGDGRGVLEAVPPPDTPADGCAACILPFTDRAGSLLTRYKPYINLLYT